MKLIAAYEDSLYMFVDDNINEYDESTKCRVYDTYREKMSPELCIGSWTARVFPWRLPTEEELANDWSKMTNGND